MRDGAILLAAGAGSRMQDATSDKILHPVLGKPVFQYSLEAFATSGLFSELVVVYRDQAQHQALQSIRAKLAPSTPITYCSGGSERMHSVRNGLAAFQTPPRQVFIHDCARPMIQPAQLRELAEEARTHGAACLAHPVADTLMRTDGRNPAELTPVNRRNLWRWRLRRCSSSMKSTTPTSRPSGKAQP